ncbi:hypothetical protein J6590_060391 [Homalodisca vitripennis]|nr:hypothetical protein J6590_060391 [Homalodisca vitripennis]
MSNPVFPSLCTFSSGSARVHRCRTHVAIKRHLSPPVIKSIRVSQRFCKFEEHCELCGQAQELEGPVFELTLLDMENERQTKQHYWFRFLNDGSTQHQVFGGIFTPEFRLRICSKY